MTVHLSQLVARGSVESPQLIGTDVTDASGNWAVPRPSVSIPADATLEIEADIDDRPLIYDFPAETVSSASSATRGHVSARTLPTQHLSLRAGTGLVAPGHGSSGSTSSRSTLDGSSSFSVVTDTAVASAADVEGDSDTTGPSDGSDEARPDGRGGSICGGGLWVWAPLNKYKMVWVPLKTSRTLGKSVLHYNWSTTTETRMDIAVVDDGGGYAGGLASSEVQETSTGLSPDWPNNTSKLVRTEWRYRKYQVYCMGGTTWALYKWVPNYPELFTKAEANDPDFPCGISGPVNATITLTNTAKVTWLKWFSIAGIKLDNTQTQATTTGLVIDPDTRQTPRYCVSGTSLKSSAFVREIPS